MAAGIAFGLVATGPALMIVGLVVMVASFVKRRIGSVVAARLLLSGPGLTLVGVAFIVLQTDIDLPARIVVAVVPLMSGIAVCAAALRAHITFAPLQ